eukprot:15474240-Alexandrium_andersonii.AAC.1
MQMQPQGALRAPHSALGKPDTAPIVNVQRAMRESRCHPNPRSEHPGSTAICNPQPAIYNPQSALRSTQSALRTG